jgi:hypothetical protein
MGWAFLFTIVVCVVIMSLNGKNRVPWSNKLRRLHVSVPEWMAPAPVVKQVRNDYLGALDWLQASALKSFSHQSAAAPLYLSGRQLRRHRTIIQQYQNIAPPQVVAVLRADHRVYVRRFSEDGERCLVIDQQTQRRMATYDYERQSRLHTQDLGDSTLVYEMVYDLNARRWKIDSFIQQLPAGWDSPSVIRHLEWMAEAPPHTGRDY